jgi:serine/threonine-protein kinase
LLHEMLANRHLFVVESERETLRRLSEVAVAAPSRWNPYIKRNLDEVVMRALDRDPQRRYPTANDLADALEKVEPTAAPPERVGHFMLQVLGGVAAYHRPIAPIAPTARASTATVNARPRRVPPAQAAPRRRRAAHFFTRLVFGATVLVAALLAPMPHNLPSWWPLDAEDSAATTARPPTTADAPAAPPATEPAAAPPAAAPVAPAPAPAHPASSSRKHHRQRRVRVATVSNGRVVDPFLDSRRAR